MKKRLFIFNFIVMFICLTRLMLCEALKKSKMKNQSKIMNQAMDLQTFQKEIWIYKNKLLRFAHQLLHQASDAEDIVQEVFLRMWKMGEKLDEYKSKEALAMQITKNLCADKRKLKQSQNYTLDDKAFKTLSNMPTPDKITELNQTKNLIDWAISQLPENQQIIIKLRDIEEYKFEEIAEIIQMDINNIRVNLSRARKKIRDFLIEKENYGQGKL